MTVAVVYTNAFACTYECVGGRGHTHPQDIRGGVCVFLTTGRRRREEARLSFTVKPECSNIKS